MPARRKSLIGRIVSLFTLRLIPIVVIGIILLLGRDVVDAFFRQMDERNHAVGQSEQFAEVATQIGELPTLTSTPQPTSAPTTVPTNTDQPTDTPQPTATATDQPSDTPTDQPSDTPEPTATATDQSSDTPTDQPSDTPELTVTYTPLPTDTVEPTETDTPERLDNVAGAAQFGATNTPRPFAFATNTPGALSTSTPPPTATPLPPVTQLPTSTPEPTGQPLPPPAIPTATAEAVAEGPTSTPRPLPTVLMPREPGDGQVIDGTAVPTRVPFVPREYDLLNVLLLGGDEELSNDGFPRTDTMIVVSINRDTGTVSMLSLPRDLFVYIPTVNGQMNRLNVVYAIGENIGWEPAGGFGLLRQTILYNFGINVHYYARVNFSGFQQVIDTLGGIDIAVDCAYQDYGLIGAEVPEGAEVTDEDGLRTLDVGYYRMNGAEALWYSRTRRNSSDFDRGRRQQQVLRAIWRKALDTTSITDVPDLWNQFTQVVDTDLGFDDVLGQIPLAFNLDVSRLESYTLIRTYHTLPWQTPNGDFVQLPVYDTLRPLLEDFYRPPSESQLLVQGATIAVYNGSANEDWDRVAAERLAWEGFRAVPMGYSDEQYAQTVLIDYTGQQKGSSLNEIARLLNVNPENIQVLPDAARTTDFAVFLGGDYNSCDASVLPVN